MEHEQGAAIGADMPELALVGGDGSASTLGAVRDGRPAVVFFLRAATCAVCLQHARALAALAQRGRLGDAVAVLVVPGGPREAARVAERVPGPVIARASQDAHAAAGLAKRLLLQHSGTFLVDAAGRVRYARAAGLPTGNWDEGELLDALAGLSQVRPDA